MNKAKSPNFWLTALTILAIVGTVLSITGRLAGANTIECLGFILIVPLLIGGIVVLVVVIPILVIANRRR